MRLRTDEVMLGVFDNTYYDFPNEGDFPSSPTSTLRDPSCKSLGEVSRAFFESLCVQGSGKLRTGQVVSFGKRDCSCADTCPRTNQKICFQPLDAREFPWGRGAMGKPISPLRTVAVDPSVIPLGSALFLPELVGLSLPDGSTHDGCVLALDRGGSIRGRKIDIFTGRATVTRSVNAELPSHKGVHVVSAPSRCVSPL